jgi:hypothetical protein
MNDLIGYLNEIRNNEWFNWLNVAIMNDLIGYLNEIQKWISK